MEHASNINTALIQQGIPKPNPQWLTNLLQTQRAAAPLPALTATVKHRLLASNFTDNVLAPNTPSFPRGVSSPNTKELSLMGPIPVQILGIEDISKSRWEQIEAIEAQERGETTKGREIIRVVADEEGENGQGQSTRGGNQQNNPAGGAKSFGTHKLILQDIKGQTVFAFEMKKIPKIEVGMSIGTKMVLKNVLIARGMVMLEPEKVVVLGGKIDALHKAWMETRKKELMEAAGVRS